MSYLLVSRSEITFISIKYHTKVFCANHALLFLFCQFYHTLDALKSYEKHFDNKTLAYLTPFTADILPTNCQHTSHSKSLGTSEKTALLNAKRNEIPSTEQGRDLFSIVSSMGSP